MKFIRKALLIVLLLFVTTITALWAVTFFVQPDSIRLLAKKQLSTLTHQDSAIDGRINWRIFPRFGLHVTKVRIGSVEKTNEDYALQVENLLFHVKIIPIFHGKLVFDKLILDGFTLRINRDGNKVTPPPKPEKKKATKSKIFIPTRIALKSLLLTNGKIIFSNKGEQVLLNQVRLEAKLPEDHREQFPIQLKATLENPTGQFNLQGTLSYKGLIKLPPLDTESTQLENIELDGQTTLQNFHAGEYNITSANAHVFYRQGKLELNPLTLSLYNGESVGKLAYQFDTHELKLSQTGTGLNAEPVFKHVLDVRPSRLSGTLDFSLHANAKLSLPEWRRKMEVTGSFTVRNGALAYINIPAITKEATKTIHNIATENLELIQQSLDNLKPWNLNSYSGDTPFQLANFQYHAKGDGTLDYSLLLETKKLNLKGHGTLNLETDAIQAHVTAHITTKDKTMKAVQAFLGNSFPLRVTGTLQNPVLSADKRLIRHMISNNVLPKALVKPLKKLKKHIKKFKYAPTQTTTE